MGKGTITSNAGDGYYAVTLDYGTADIAARIAEIDADIVNLQADIATLNSERLTESDRISDLLSAVNSAIAALDGSPESIKAVTEANTEYLAERTTLSVIERDISLLNVMVANLQARRASLADITLTAAKGVWCADWSPKATGEVATIEVNAEQPQILIAPGAPAPQESDGVLTHRMAMSGTATYLNAALLPGVQRWSPGYRAGIITSIDRAENTGNVTLDDAKSSAQDLSINATNSLEGIEFDYMTCHHAAFVAGDEVVVGFEGSWSAPKIIGFQKNPKPCGPEFVWIPITRGNAFLDIDPFPTSEVYWPETYPNTNGSRMQSRIVYSEVWVWDTDRFVMGYSSPINGSDPDYTAAVTKVDGAAFGGTLGDCPLYGPGGGSILQYNHIADLSSDTQKVTGHDWVIPGAPNPDDRTVSVIRQVSEFSTEIVSRTYYDEWSEIRAIARADYESYFGPIANNLEIDFGLETGAGSYEPVWLASGWYRRNAFYLKRSNGTPSYFYNGLNLSGTPFWPTYLWGYEPSNFAGMLYRRVGSQNTLFSA